MKNIEAIREDLAPFPIRSSTIIRQCKKHDVDPDGEWEDEIKISICVIEILSQMIALGGVSEGGVSFSFDSTKAEALLRRKCREANLDESLYISAPIVTRLE